jgi:hypothetical protein
VHQENYNISRDWNGTSYCGLTLEWDYKNRKVDLSMHGYIKAALHKYQHPAPARPEHSPHTWSPPTYGPKTQFVTETITSPALSDKEINKLQQLTCTLLYYARAVDPTLIMPINVLASEQSTATNVAATKIIELLNYMHYVHHLTRFTRLCVTSHSQPLINTKYQIQVTKYL